MARNKYQDVLMKYAEKMKRALPLKICETGELLGLDVLQCYGAYFGDMKCVRCPARGYCLKA